MDYQFSLDFARNADARDQLSGYRDQFHFPEHKGEKAIYFTGNSLGLQPKNVTQYIDQELKDWAQHGVEGHFKAKRPWFSYHELFSHSVAQLVGAQSSEVVVMNGLTLNLHLLLVSFYRPSGSRVKILCESKAFPSDRYALTSQIRFHGYDPDEVLVEIEPADGAHTIRQEDVIAKIEELGDELAVIMMGGVNYYSGQAFDMKAITEAGHKVGAKVGFDLAHAAGNLQLQLHDWKVDFAAWCSYKYLNSGPGGVSGVYIHEDHCRNKELPRFAGWWGHDKKKRFLMEKEFDPMTTAEGWQLSNAPVLAMAAHRASLDIFDEVGMDKLCMKRDRLTGYLEYLIGEVSERAASGSFEIITPRDKRQRGCQLSILCHGRGKELFDTLAGEGVVADWREPNVIRVAPVPLYNSFEDVFRFGKILADAIN